MKLQASLIAMLFLSLAGSVALAQSPSPSGSAELREIIRQRIEQTLEDKKNPKAAFIGTLGTISKVGTSTFVLTDTTGRERTIDISAETTILSKNTPVKLSELTINSGAVVMGTAVDEVIVAARRVLVQEDNFAENRTVVLGIVESLEKNVLTIRERATGEVYSVDLKTTTKYEDIVGTTVDRKLLEADQATLVVIDTDANQKKFARRVRLLVPVTVGSTTGSPSSTPKASPSPTPKAAR